MAAPDTYEIEADTPLVFDQPDVPAPGDRPMDHRTQPKKKDRAPIPARQGNGYYADHHTGDRLRSVTTILGGGVPKPGLMFWAANTCTDSAIDNLPALVAASRHPEQLAELRDWIKRAHTRKKDERAEVGSAVHAIVESRILGTPLPPAVVVGEEEWDFDGPELAPYIAAFLRFEEEWEPTWLASEMVVANPEHGYAGTLDYIISGGRGVVPSPIAQALIDQGYTIGDADIMGDTKTGGEWDRTTASGHVHGVYPEAGLQMAAYRNATTCWLRDGTRAPMPPTAEVGVILHLRPEGYRLYPARCGATEYRYFRHAQMVDEWASRIASARADSPVIGPPLTPPTTSTTREAS
jgi:hypothetical protein